MSVKKDLIALYKKEWEWNNEGNKHHFDVLMHAIKANCRPRVDLLVAQGIDVNAIDENGNTVLHETCKKDDYAWATRKLVACKLCNINAITHDTNQMPLYVAITAGGENNIKTLLTCDGVKVRTKDAFGCSLGIVVESYEVYQLLCAVDSSKDI